MRRLFGPVGLVVFLVSSEAVSETALQTGGSHVTGERTNLLAILTIKQNMRKVFHSLASPRVKLSSECCHFAWFPLCPRTFYFPVLCR